MSRGSDYGVLSCLNPLYDCTLFRGLDLFVVLLDYFALCRRFLGSLRDEGFGWSESGVKGLAFLENDVSPSCLA